MLIRRTQTEDVHRLPAIEIAAGELFRSLPDLAWIADEQPTCIETHRRFVGAGLSWVAVIDEHAAGFLVAERHERALHLVELSVHPDVQRRGVGSALLRRGVKEARHRRLESVTLTTFRDVPWNGPFYRRQGFEEVPSGQLTDHLRRVLEAEQEAGLPVRQRCAMQRRDILEPSGVF